MGDHSARAEALIFRHRNLLESCEQSFPKGKHHVLGDAAKFSRLGDVERCGQKPKEHRQQQESRDVVDRPLEGLGPNAIKRRDGGAWMME